MPQIVLSALFMIFKGAPDTSALVNAGASMLLLARHVFTDGAAEVKRVLKARQERAAATAVSSIDKPISSAVTTSAEGADSVEDMADALQGRGQIAHLLLAAPWCNFISTLLLGPISFFMAPGARPLTTLPHCPFTVALTLGTHAAFRRPPSPPQ